MATITWCKKQAITLTEPNDKKHRDGSRSVDITINDNTYTYNHISADYTNDDMWGWENVGEVDVKKQNKTNTTK